MLNMFADDFVDVFFVDVGVPGFFGIHDDDWAFVAAVETAGAVDAHFARAIEFQCFDFIFGVAAHSFRAAIVTTSFAVFALVDAKKYVVFVEAHNEMSKN